MVMQAPAMPFGVWAVMFSLTLAAVYVCREDIRALAVERPVAAKVVAFALLAIGGAVAMEAAPLGRICDWGSLLDLCGGWQACAWAAWYGNGCYV